MTDMATARYYPGPFASHSSRGWETRKTVLLALTVALLSATAVFLLLCERDHAFSRQVSRYETQQYVRQTASAIPAAAPATSASGNPKASVQAVQAYIPFEITRSKHYQRVGPISVGIWRTDEKRGTYDVSLLVAGERFDKKHVGMDQALAIRIGDGAPMELVVNHVGRSDVSGYLTTPNQTATR